MVSSRVFKIGEPEHEKAVRATDGIIAVIELKGFDDERGIGARTELGLLRHARTGGTKGSRH